jgi:Domain of unknown function (DUF2341)
VSGTNIDHIVSIIVFLAAMLIFIGLFGQTIETAILYQQHNVLATKASDLLDNMLLSPGNPTNWSQTDWNQQSKVPTGLGLQNPEFVQYQLSPFSLMRLHSSAGTAVNYQGQAYCNTTTNSIGSSLLVPSNQMINYSQASKMLGINGTYGFSLTVSPTIDVSVSEITYSPLNISVSAKGQGSPLAKASVSYCLITVTGYDSPDKPSFVLNYGTATADEAGSVCLDLSSFSTTQKSYAIIVHVSLSGLSGIGYFSHSLYSACSVVPLISSFENRSVLLAHSYSINQQGYNGSISYNATFLRATDMLRASLNGGNSLVVGELHVDPTPAHAFDAISVDPNNIGVLVVVYSKSALESGIALMPWGLSSLDFSVTFGGVYKNQNWVSTDIRQVLVNGITYQAKLALWESTISEANPNPVDIWLSGWNFRKSHIVDGSATTAGTDYQIRFIAHYGTGVDNGENVYLGNKAKTDFGDVRFVQSDKQTLLSYWLESKIDGVSATFWVKIAGNLTAQSQTIYLYYGNSQATTESSGENTFVFFDDFSGDLSKWIKETNGVHIYIDSGHLVLDGGITSGTYGHTVLGSSASYSSFNNGLIEADVYPSTDALPEIGFRGVYSSNIGYKARWDCRSGSEQPWMTPPYNGWGVFGTSITRIGLPNQWQKAKIAVLGSTFKIYSNDVLKSSVIDGQYGNYGEISLQNHYGVSSFFDNVRVRKYVDPEPIRGLWGIEERFIAGVN